jgi:hypothetical protein
LHFDSSMRPPLLCVPFLQSPVIACGEIPSARARVCLSPLSHLCTLLSPLCCCSGEVSRCFVSANTRCCDSHRWRISYWYGFLAQFTFLPLHQEYVDSGERPNAQLYTFSICTAVVTSSLGTATFHFHSWLQASSTFCLGSSNRDF